mgnify:FL=1
MKENRAASVTHSEYEILKFITEEIDLRTLEKKMALDRVSKERFGKAGKSVLQLITNMMERRRHKLPLNHVDYKEKET